MFLPLTLLVLGTLVLAIKTGQVVRDKQLILSQIRGKGTPDAPTKQMTDAELITARQMIEGYASLYSLPVEVKLEKREIRIRIRDAKKEEVAPSAPTSESEKAEKAAQHDQERLAVLEDFKSVTGFFTSISKMPYPLEYKEFCVGVDCPNVFDVSVTPRNLAEQPAPTAPRKPA